MSIADAETHSAIDRLVHERLIRASRKIRKKLPSNIVRKNFFSLTYREDNVFVYLLLGRELENGVQHRTNLQQPPIPGLITTRENISAGIRLENSQLAQITNASFKNIFALSVGSSVSVQFTNITIDLLDVGAVREKFIVDLGFAISPEKGKLIFSPLEQIEDLIVQFVSSIVVEQQPESGLQKEQTHV